MSKNSKHFRHILLSTIDSQLKRSEWVLLSITTTSDNFFLLAQTLISNFVKKNLNKNKFKLLLIIIVLFFFILVKKANIS